MSSRDTFAADQAAAAVQDAARQTRVWQARFGQGWQPTKAALAAVEMNLLAAVDIGVSACPHVEDPERPGVVVAWLACAPFTIGCVPCRRLALQTIEQLAHHDDEAALLALASCGACGRPHGGTGAVHVDRVGPTLVIAHYCGRCIESTGSAL